MTVAAFTVSLDIASSALTDIPLEDMADCALDKISRSTACSDHRSLDMI